MLPKRKNRKSKSYFKYLGIILTLLGFSLILSSTFIFLSPYILGNSFVSPLPKNSKSKTQDVRALLASQKINVSSFSVATDSSYMVVLKDGGTVILAPGKDLAAQVRSLQIILSRLTIEGKRFKILDFRFDKPVVSF